MSILKVRGTNDFLPKDTAKWHVIEGLLHQLCREYGYGEIRTPIFENTELFIRGVGDTTDIVQKEMYTFLDSGGRSLTLRPENTASACRAYLENKLASAVQPVKLYYIGPMFRYERPQAGRFRQFHQFGVECFGSSSPLCDAEVIALAWELFNRAGLNEKTLVLNSVGCPKCRPLHKKALQDFLRPHLDELCPLCQDRFARNPMRILDCKNPECQAICAEAPNITDYLCEECRDHFQTVQELLTAAGIPYTLNPRLVRGLDYYTKTAFEIQNEKIGAKGAMCGGGRYDGLADDIGGVHVPAVGFAVGIERILNALEAQGEEIAPPETLDVYIADLDNNAASAAAAFNLTVQLRAMGFRVEQDLLGRSLKSQFKQADRLLAQFVVIVGGEEFQSGKVAIRRMADGEQSILPLTDVKSFLLENEL